MFDAVVAVPTVAAADPGIDHRFVTNFGAFAIGSDRRDFAHYLMAHGARRIHGLGGRIFVAAAHVEEAFPEMHVAVADAGCGDAHQHLGTLRRRIGLFDPLQRLAELDDLVALHGRLPNYAVAA